MKTNIHISNLSLALAFVMVLVILVISYWQKLKLDKEIAISIGRAIIQLTIVGFMLRFIFQVNNFYLTIAMVVFILLNTAFNGRDRSKGIPHAFMITLGSITVGTVVTLALMLGSGVIKFVPFQLIPVAGMIAGNSMASVGLLYSSLNVSFKENEEQVIEMLALGGSPQLAGRHIMRQAIRFGLQPTIDSVRTYGIVQLPGMMSGLIMAGVDPVEAIKYQILIVFMLFCSCGISTVIAGFWAVRQFFNKDWQLVLPTPAVHKKISFLKKK